MNIARASPVSNPKGLSAYVEFKIVTLGNSGTAGTTKKLGSCTAATGLRRRNSD